PLRGLVLIELDCRFACVRNFQAARRCSLFANVFVFAHVFVAHVFHVFVAHVFHVFFVFGIRVFFVFGIRVFFVFGIRVFFVFGIRVFFGVLFALVGRLSFSLFLGFFFFFLRLFGFLRGFFSLQSFFLFGIAARTFFVRRQPLVHCIHAG